MNTDPGDKMIDIAKFDADGHPFMEKYLLRKGLCPLAFPNPPHRPF